MNIESKIYDFLNESKMSPEEIAILKYYSIYAVKDEKIARNQIVNSINDPYDKFDDEKILKAFESLLKKGYIGSSKEFKNFGLTTKGKSVPIVKAKHKEMANEYQQLKYKGD